MSNLTVEPHPMAERERHEKRGQLGPFQKQHCLFGWFGIAGAEKVMLLARWEWPSQELAVRSAAGNSVGDGTAGRGA